MPCVLEDKSGLKPPDQPGKDEMDFTRKPEHQMSLDEQRVFGAWEAWLARLLVDIRLNRLATTDTRDQMPELPTVWPAEYSMELLKGVLERLGVVPTAASSLTH